MVRAVAFAAPFVGTTKGRGVFPNDLGKVARRFGKSGIVEVVFLTLQGPVINCMSSNCVVSFRNI